MAVLAGLVKNLVFTAFFKGNFWDFFAFMYVIQHWFICRPSDSTVSEDAGFEPETVACDFGIDSQTL